MSAANNILAADTDIHTSAAASSSKQHPSFEVLFPSLPHSKFCSPYSYPQSQFAREFKYEWFIHKCKPVALWIKLETHSPYRRRQQPELARAPLKATPTFVAVLITIILFGRPKNAAKPPNILKRTVTSIWLGFCYRLWSSECFLFLPFSGLAVWFWGFNNLLIAYTNSWT